MRNASSMLELVVAIVVMGIAMMTLPLMLTTTQKNNTFAMRQEAIYAARTQISDMLTYFWDENSVDANLSFGVLDTNSTNNIFERVPGTIRRIGHAKRNKRRKYFTSTTYATSPANLGKDGIEATPNDIDDFSTGVPTTIQPSTQNADIGFDYKYILNMTTTVSYIDDNFTSGSTFDFNTSTMLNSTNIKMSTLTITNNNDFNITLRAYSSNIGASQLLRRDF